LGNTGSGRDIEADRLALASAVAKESFFCDGKLDEEEEEEEEVEEEFIMLAPCAVTPPAAAINAAC